MQNIRNHWASLAVQVWEHQGERGLLTRGVWQETLRDDLGLGPMHQVHQNTGQARATALHRFPSPPRDTGFLAPTGCPGQIAEEAYSLVRPKHPPATAAWDSGCTCYTPGEGKRPGTESPEIPLRTGSVPKCHGVRSNLNRAQSCPGSPVNGRRWGHLEEAPSSSQTHMLLLNSQKKPTSTNTLPPGVGSLEDIKT